MKKFIVYSAIPKSKMDVMACVTGFPKMLKDAGVKGVQVNRCYCCSPPNTRKVIVEFEAPSKESLSEALQKMAFPFESITEVTEVKT